MKKVVVTGGNGKTGMWVVNEFLEKGYEVLSADINITLNSGTAGNEIHFMRSGTGNVIFVQGSGVTINSFNNYKKINDHYQAVTAKCISTNNWVLFGALKA